MDSSAIIGQLWFRGLVLTLSILFFFGMYFDSSYDGRGKDVEDIYVLGTVEVSSMTERTLTTS